MDSNKLLEIEKEKLKSVIDGIKEGVIIIDSEQRITDINKAACEITGFETSEAINQPLDKILNLRDETDSSISPEMYCPIGQIDVKGVVYSKSNLSVIDRNNIVKKVDLNSRKIKEGSLAKVGCIVLLNNVSQLSEIERMKEDFVSMAVHVLRTPVAVLRGYLDGLIKPWTIKKLDEGEVDKLHAALAGADELRTLVENLLYLSEIQTGKFNVYPIPINLEGIVTSVVRDYKSVADNKGIEMRYVPPLYEFPMVRGDIQRIREVMVNLMENALKYTEKGYIEVSLGVEKGFAKVTVKDTGLGIPDENLHFVFTKFYRIKDPLEMESGSGIGLYIVKKIIDAHNGEIWVDSQLGEGSTFYFTLPLA